MNPQLLSLPNLLAYLQDALSQHLVAVTLGVAAVIALVVFAAGKFGASREEAPAAPATAPVVPLRPAPAPVPAAAAGPAAILVVDDSAVARAKLRKLFEASGYRVEVARDGVEALEALAGGFYSVLITDLEMPNMNGLELIANVQGSLDTEDLPIIAITGHDELQARVHDYQSLYGIFKKPWNDRDLLKRVEALAHLRGQPGVSLPH